MIKRGQITSTQLVSLILIVVGFILAVMFLRSVFENKDLEERDLCRLSIISRATVPGVAEQAVPLNCFTEKICITVKGKDNSCEQFAGEKNVRDVVVDLDNPLKAADEIQRNVANAMYDCWLMTGQGKMDIFKGTSSTGAEGVVSATAAWTDIIVEDIKPTCLVCSRVAFSDVLTKSDKWTNTVNNINYNDFLRNKPIPGSNQKYMGAFTGNSGSGYGDIQQDNNLIMKYLDAGKFDEIREILKKQVGGDAEEIKKITALKDEEIKERLGVIKSKPTASNQIAILFAQIKVSDVTSNDQFWNTFKSGVALGSFTALSGPGKVLNLLNLNPVAKVLVTAAAVGGVSTYLAFDAKNKVEANQVLSAATCGDFQSTAQGQKGCSLVKLMNWDIPSVNGLCGNGIEGNL